MIPTGPNQTDRYFGSWREACQDRRDYKRTKPSTLGELILGRQSVKSEDEPGRILSRLHWQRWQSDAPPTPVTDAEFISVLPIVIRSGSVGLVWPRMRDRFDPDGAVAMAMEAANQAQVRHNALVEERISQAASRMKIAGIEPVIVKGWSVARLYPKALVRIAGDIDLVVSDRDFFDALETLYGWAEETGEITISMHDPRGRPDPVRKTARSGAGSVDIDLHRSSQWADSPSPDFLDHSLWIPVGNEGIHGLAPEDNLRLLSFHYLRHGATRLLRLCDIALVLESRPADFSWNRCLGTDPMRANWVTSTLVLANQLVGAGKQDTPN